MRSTRALSVAVVCVSLSWGAFAGADVVTPGDPQVNQTVAAQVVNVASGATRGRLDGDMRLRYPGFEQTTVVNTNNHIVLVTMEAVQEPGIGPVQCSCSSYELQANGPPKLVTDLKRLTAYGNGERTCNHPKATADENGNIVWMFGSDTGDNQPNTYAGVINDKCEQLSAPQMVSIQRNANDGAPDIAYLGNGNFVAGYYSDGGDTPTGPFPAEGGRYSVAMNLHLDNSQLLPTLTRTWIAPIVTPTNIGRPTIAAVAPDRALFCAPKGPNRPSDHIGCALLDQSTGNKVWENQVATGDRQKSIYYNQPTVAKLADNKFALVAIESSGQGKNGRNVKGANLSHLFMLERNGDSVAVTSEIVGAAAHQTHASICTGSYGEAGAPTVAVFSAAPTGIGRAAMTMVGFDDAIKQFKFDPVADLWPAAWYGDSGHLANWYGRNPMRQGRDFMRCIGDVANPGYHVQNGYMSDVKTFFIGAVHGRIPGDAKNSLFLSIVPGQMDKKAAPQNPVPAGETPSLGTDATTPTDTSASGSTGGCGCTTVGSTSVPGSIAAALGALAMGMVFVRRRRR
jgi:MYXO-CTERM domain-containing protein